jgi:ABC-2 type transport system ATP-binding protein
MSDIVVLRADGLTKKYGSLIAVNDLTFDVHQGEIMGFLGPNGAGKTTSIDMLCGLRKPDRGQVLVHGKPLDQPGAKVRGQIGVCPQEVILWERLTCIEQLQFMGQMYGMSRSSAATRSKLLLDEYHLAEKRNSQARTLSGGMKRRLNLAMALVHDPEILLLDEPEVGLDPQSRVSVRSHIRSFSRTKTVILATHNMDEAERLADRVAIIDQGELLVMDSPKALKRSIGEGDVLEIDLAGDAGRMDQAIDLVRKISDGISCTFGQGTLIIKAPNISGFMVDVLEIIENQGLQTSEVRLRETTLEDVFIHLTGRRLRE